MEASDTVSYQYDHTGQRTLKNNGTTTTLYPFKYYELAATVPTKYIYAGDTLIATIEGTGTTTLSYNHSDHLGSTNATTDEYGFTTEVLAYHPFGDSRVSENYGHGSTKTYIGETSDTETEMSYLGAQYYAGDTGRFTSQDPVSLALGDWKTVQDKTGGKIGFYLQNPQTHNSYSYTANNPLKYVDKNGEFLWFAAAIGVAIVADQLMNATVLTDDANMNVPTQNSSLPELAMQDAGINPTSVMIVGTAGDLYGASKGNFRSVQDIIGSAKNVWRNNDGTTFGERSGGFGVAEQDFRSLNPQNIKKHDNGLISGQLDNGDKVNVRPFSSDNNRSTLEIQHSDGSRTKIRYNDDND